MKDFDDKISFNYEALSHFPNPFTFFFESVTTTITTTTTTVIVVVFSFVLNRWSRRVIGLQLSRIIRASSSLGLISGARRRVSSSISFSFSFSQSARNRTHHHPSPLPPLSLFSFFSPAFYD